MERLTHQTRWTNDIDLKQEYGYKHIYQRLCEYENTGLTPEEIIQLQKKSAELEEKIQQLENEPSVFTVRSSIIEKAKKYDKLMKE